MAEGDSQPPPHGNTLDYKSPQRHPNRSAAIAVWIITAIIALPVALGSILAFGFIAGNGAYGQLAILAAVIIGFIFLIVAVARKAKNPLSAAVAGLLCVCALGLLTFGLCANGLSHGL